MNVTVENLGPCKKLLRIEVDADAVNKAFSEITQRYVRAGVIPGFRPGKAPLAMVEKKYGKDIEDEVRKKLIPDSYRDAVKNEKLSVVGQPNIEETVFGKSQPLQLAVTVETEPEFTLPEHIGLPVRLEVKSVTQVDVDKALQALRDRRTKFEPVQRPAQDGDVVVINYRGSCEGKPISEWAPTARGLTEKAGFWIEITPTSFIPGFGPQLAGASAGEKRTVEVDFDADFVTKEISGKKGVFEVEVTEVREKIAPALDDDFAKAYGADNLDRLREGVWADLERELEYQKGRVTRTQISKALLDAVQCELPEAVLLSETRRIVYDIVEENRKRGVPAELVTQKEAEIYSTAKTTAVDRIKLAFIFQRIAQKENIELKREEIFERVQQLAAQAEMTVEKYMKELDKGAGIAWVYEMVMNEKVMNFLVKNAKIEEVTVEAAPQAAAPQA